ncbi:hypothetical protein JY651_31400 [Pyxidicoccus parkwayensis]|uniref:Acyloxyacyl hydrolase n=1 Tax=Pyxidicoccus parkwayensis TaxID=2813578 RepID=A0ABX7NUH5_9BACT|nr:hypothetical protein [Pyxidicoccus parkwaysis]QSQ19778.1 hypothetical protein JY651_31400 [Pyxidicoccus parkwaysis]
MNTLRTAFLLGALGLTSTARAEEPPSATNHELLIHGWRSPSIGVEYRRGFLGIHAGAYPTVISRDTSGGSETTWFAKAGLTGYFLPLRLTSERPSLAFVSVAYLRGLNRGWDDAFFLEAGFRWAVWKGLDLRLGAGLLLAPGRSPRVNPTPGVSWSFPLPG